MSGELPLTKDPASKYVPWTIGLMMYLSSLAVFVFVISFQIMISFSEKNESKFLLIFPSYIPIEETQNSLSWLQEQPSITRLSLLFGDAKTEGLLSTSQETENTLFVEIEMIPSNDAELTSFLKSVSTLSEDIRIIPQKTSMAFSPLTTLSLEIFIILLAVAFILTPIITVSFASTTSFLIHKNIIVLLSLLGASDAQIAREFQKNAHNLSLKGGLLCYGLLLFSLVLAFFAFSGQNPDFIIQNSTLILFTFLSLFFIPPFLGVIMSFATRQSVMKQLSRSDA